MKISVNVRYMFIQGLFWMIFCVGSGFVSLYLLDVGISNSSIGVVSAVFGTFSAILQPVLGRICDRRKDVSFKSMSVILALCFTTICFLMIFFTGKIISSIFLGTLIMLANLIMPFVNSALFYYEGAGEHINFGVARGMGSGMYALMALLIGNLAVAYGTVILPVMGVIVAILFTIVVITMPYDANLDVTYNSENKDKKDGKTPTNDNFIKKYPAFIIMVVAFILSCTTHNITCTYLLQIIQNLGGDSKNLGTAVAIQAVVEVPVLFCFSILIKKFKISTLMLTASFGYVLKAALHFLSGSVMAIYFSQFAQMLSFAIFASASVYYTGQTIKDEDRTTGQAMMASVIVIGTLIGSLVGGWLLDLCGMKIMLAVNIGIGVLGFIVALIATAVDKKIRTCGK